MEDSLIHSAVNGIFGALFIWLLFTTMKKMKCEKEYQKIISEKNQQVIREQAKSF
ncbi:BhlA/UviB family holin-like peptide [Paenibacillus larvae]|nr:BhlA/UviB family holin-like peptide [Paenibacillus larvae]MDT2240918.1 BhlA/UviB family holin-like peptide [Paenibacillus larvae]